MTTREIERIRNSSPGGSILASLLSTLSGRIAYGFGES